LKTAKRRDLFLKILEETRRKYRFVVHGYVVMPEHFHLLITEPETGDPSVVMKVIKQRFARRANRLRKRPAPAQIGLWFPRVGVISMHPGRRKNPHIAKCAMCGAPATPPMIPN